MTDGVSIATGTRIRSRRAEAQSRLGRMIRERRAELGVSLQRLADEVGAAKSHLSMLENGRRSTANAVLLERLEATLNLSPGSLAREAAWDRTPTIVRRRISRLEKAWCARAEVDRSVTTSAEIPVFDLLDDRCAVLSLFCGVAPQRPASRSAPCDPHRVGWDGLPVGRAIDFVRCPGLDDPLAFAARLPDDSMSPIYRRGEIVVFSPARPVSHGDHCYLWLVPAACDATSRGSAVRRASDASAPDLRTTRARERGTGVRSVVGAAVFGTLAIDDRDTRRKDVIAANERDLSTDPDGVASGVRILAVNAEFPPITVAATQVLRVVAAAYHLRSCASP
jgi:repressor LexA